MAVDAMAPCRDSLPALADLDSTTQVRDTMVSDRDGGRGYDGAAQPTWRAPMPTDASAGNGGQHDEPMSPEPEDGLIFTTHDLGRDREAATAVGDGDLGFAVAPRPAERAADAGDSCSFEAVAQPDPLPATQPTHGEGKLTASDSFVISDPQRAAAPINPLQAGEPVPAMFGSEDAGIGDAAQRRSFRLDSTNAAGGGSGGEPPWVVREPSPEAVPSPSRRGWATRQSGAVDPSTHAAMLRLREEAVHVSWQAAWLAVTSVDRKLSRRRHR
jgi:hypothetical protein